MANPPAPTNSLLLTNNAGPATNLDLIHTLSGTGGTQSYAASAAQLITFTPGGTGVVANPGTYQTRGWMLPASFITPADTRGRAFLPAQDLAISCDIVSVASNGLALGQGSCQLFVALFRVVAATGAQRDLVASASGAATTTRGLGAARPTLTLPISKTYIERDEALVIQIGGQVTSPQPVLGSNVETYTLTNDNIVPADVLDMRSSYAVPVPVLGRGEAEAIRSIAFDRGGDDVVAGAAESVRRVFAGRRLAEDTQVTEDTTRRVTAVRRFSEDDVTATDQSSRRTDVTRDADEAVTTVAADAARVLTTNRLVDAAVAEVLGEVSRRVDLIRIALQDDIVDVAAERSVAYPRIAEEDVTAVDDAASRAVTFRRVTEDDSVAQLDTALRVILSYRRIAEVMLQVNDVAERLFTAGRDVRYDFQPGDEPVIDPTREIRARVRNSDGTSFGAGALVVLFRSDSNQPVSSQLSDVNGEAVWLRNSYDTATYFIAAWDQTGAPLAQAVTERTLEPEPIGG